MIWQAIGAIAVVVFGTVATFVSLWWVTTVFARWCGRAFWKFYRSRLQKRYASYVLTESDRQMLAVLAQQSALPDNTLSAYDIIMNGGK